MNYKTLFLCVCVAASVVQAQTVLTYNGANDGDWFAANVWLDAASQPASWQDGAVAVITNRNVNLTANKEFPQKIWSFQKDQSERV
ncbi:MAG: hypothetical protein PHG74_15610 [Kiritimatiellae bacterium]|jgi:hypothetical protein|nr:hypothetical protein [Kiritimatiellia bacterium]